LQACFDIVEEAIDQVEACVRISGTQRGVLVGGSERADCRQREAVVRRVTGEFAFRDIGLIAHFDRESGAPPGVGRRRGDSIPRDDVSVLVGPFLDISAGIWIVVQPADNPDAADPDRDDSESSAIHCGYLQHLGDDADVGPRVTSTDLATAIDQHDTELVLSGLEAISNELLVAGLEDVQWQDNAGQQDRAQRKHRQDRH
jgi:hypothetical protein